MSMRQLDMNLVVGEAIKNASCLIRAHNATVDVDPLGFAYGHFSYLVSLFQNLISNAVLYSESKSRVHIGVTWRDTEKLYFVQDFGPGIPAELQDTIFQPFSRPNLAETKGSGLGLAICRYIVEHHGGRIFVESQPGQGSTFFFSLQPNTSEPAPSH
jgi:signal transduction histidine kinase